MVSNLGVTIEYPYIRLQHQIQNFVRFCETVVRAGSVRRITLITGYDERTPLAEMAEKLEELKQSLIEVDVELDVKLNSNIHDREIRIDNGWIVKIGRGLDFHQKPNGWFEIGANDMSLRKCLETKVDIYRSSGRLKRTRLSARSTQPNTQTLRTYNVKHRYLLPARHSPQ